MAGKKEYLDMKFQDRLLSIPAKRSRDEEDEYESTSHGHNGRTYKSRYGYEKSRRNYNDDETDDDDELPYCQQYAVSVPIALMNIIKHRITLNRLLFRNL